MGGGWAQRTVWWQSGLTSVGSSPWLLKRKPAAEAGGNDDDLESMGGGRASWNDSGVMVPAGEAAGAPASAACAPASAPGPPAGDTSKHMETGRVAPLALRGVCAAAGLARPAGSTARAMDCSTGLPRRQKGSAKKATILTVVPWWVRAGYGVRGGAGTGWGCGEGHVAASGRGARPHARLPASIQPTGGPARTMGARCASCCRRAGRGGLKVRRLVS